MNLIVTLDDQNGMLFNHRRQSRDRVLNDRIATLCGGRLTVTAYTAALLEGLPVDLTISEDPLAAAKPGDWCFLEDRSPAPALEKIEKLVVYRWNRVYPSDLKFDIDLSAMKCVSKTDFAGYSHEKLTEEVYLP